MINLLPSVGIIIQTLIFRLLKGGDLSTRGLHYRASGLMGCTILNSCAVKWDGSSQPRVGCSVQGLGFG